MTIPKIPDYLTLTGQATILDASEESKLPTFSMIAYSGGVMHIRGFPHPVVVDGEHAGARCSEAGGLVPGDVRAMGHHGPGGRAHPPDCPATSPSPHARR